MLPSTLITLLQEVGFRCTILMDSISLVGGHTHQATDPLQAETWAIWDAIHYVESKGLQNATIRSDCQRLVHILNSKEDISWHITSLCGQILNLASSIRVICMTVYSKNFQYYSTPNGYSSCNSSFSCILGCKLTFH